jgi:hypothetical protein
MGDSLGWLSNGLGKGKAGVCGVYAAFLIPLGVEAGVLFLELSGLTIRRVAFGSGSENGLLVSDKTGYARPATDDTDRRCSAIEG